MRDAGIYDWPNWRLRDEMLEFLLESGLLIEITIRKNSYPNPDLLEYKITGKGRSFIQEHENSFSAVIGTCRFEQVTGIRKAGETDFIVNGAWRVTLDHPWAESSWGESYLEHQTISFHRWDDGWRISSDRF